MVYIIIIIFGIYAGYPWIIANNLIHTDENTDAITFFISVDANIRSGVFPPSWDGNAFAGLGIPLYFWQPFVSYLIEVIHLFEPDIIKAMDLTVPIIFIASGLTMFVLLKKITKINFVSLIGSIFYIYAPYRFTDANSRGDFGESAAFIFIPLVIYFVFLARQKEKDKNIFLPILLGGASFGLLLLAHPLIIYLFFFLIFIPLAIYNVIKTRNIKEVRYYLFVFGIGMLFTAYYWLPIALERNFIVPGFAMPIENMVVPLSVVIFNQLWNIRPDPLFSNFVGYPALAAIVSGFILSYRNRTILYPLLFSIILIFLMVEPGIHLLKLLPLVDYIQFTTRILSLIVFTTSILLSLVIKEIYTIFSEKFQKPRIKRIFIFSIITIVISSIFITSYPLTEADKYGLIQASKEQLCCSVTIAQWQYLPIKVPYSYSQPISKLFQYPQPIREPLPLYEIVPFAYSDATNSSITITNRFFDMFLYDNSGKLIPPVYETQILSNSDFTIFQQNIAPYGNQIKLVMRSPTTMVPNTTVDNLMGIIQSKLTEPTARNPTPENNISGSIDTSEKNPIQISIDNKPTKWIVKTTSTRENLVSFRIFYYPGWVIYLDGKELPKSYDANTGRIITLIPAGTHEIKIIFEDTLVRLIAKIITLVFILTIFSLLIINKVKKQIYCV
jgi:hypothetical protein